MHRASSPQTQSIFALSAAAHISGTVRQKLKILSAAALRNADIAERSTDIGAQRTSCWP
jgi:hypothetical protein